MPHQGLCGCEFVFPFVLLLVLHYFLLASGCDMKEKKPQCVGGRGGGGGCFLQLLHALHVLEAANQLL